MVKTKNQTENRGFWINRKPNQKLKFFSKPNRKPNRSHILKMHTPTS